MRRWLLWFLVLVTLPAIAHAQLAGFATSATFPKANAAGGTTVGLLAKITPTGVTTALTTDTDIPLYLVTAGAGATGTTATLLVAGPGQCLMDAANASGVAGYYVVTSSTTNGKCHAQVGPPSSGFAVGIMLDDTTVTTAGVMANVLMVTQPFFPATGAGSGTVTSLELTMPAEWTLTGCTITTAGTCAVTKAVQAANTLYAGPTTGADAAPAFRALVSTDIPTGTYNDPTGLLTMGSLALAGDLTPTTLSGNVNDYQPAGITTTILVRIDGGAADREISGLYAGADGEVKVLQNSGTTNTLILKEEAGSSAASGRFHVGGNVLLSPGEALAVVYDVTAARWRPLTNGSTRKLPPRVTTVATGVTLACNVDLADSCSMTHTGAAGTLTLSAPTGSPQPMQKVMYRIVCTNAQTYAFNAVFRFSSTVFAPATCGAGNTDYLGAVWNDLASTWDVVAVDQGH